MFGAIWPFRGPVLIWDQERLPHPRSSWLTSCASWSPRLMQVQGLDLRLEQRVREAEYLMNKYIE